MPFMLSPGVKVREIDLTTIVPAVATSEGAIAGPMRWGPIGQRVTVDSESNLVARFGKPTNLNAETWFTAASFLGYGNRLIVSRAANTTGIAQTLQVTVDNANSTLVITGGANNANITAGMVILASSNDSLISQGVVASTSATNQIILTSGSFALVDGSANVTFVSNAAVFSALANTNGVVTNFPAQIVKNEDHFTTLDGTFDTNVSFVARYPGEVGNTLRLSVCASADGYSKVNDLSVNTNPANTCAAAFSVNTNGNSFVVVVTTSAPDVTEVVPLAIGNAVKAFFRPNDRLLVGNTTTGTQALQISSVGNVTTNSTAGVFTVNLASRYTLASNVAYNGATAGANTITSYWEFYDMVDTAPGQSDYVRSFGNTAAEDEMHVVVVDEGGKFTGVAGTILEVYRNVSRATDGKTSDGATNYWRSVINDASQYVWAVNDISGAASATALNVADATLTNGSWRMDFGADGSDETAMSLAVFAAGYDLFRSAEDVDISLILTGRSAGSGKANYLIDNIAEERKDCVVFVSPQKGDVVNNVGSEADAVVAFRNTLRSTSYAVMDSSYKYMYDRYNDVYRWVPLNGDIGGLCARTDDTNDPWWSPAGLNRGQIKNLVRLAFNPRKSERDTLYKGGVNPVVTFPGQGTVLFGDKTMLAKPSAFDRINVRRLFIVLEKAIATASKFTLFEFNDEFTRAQFRSLVIPYLRNVQSRKGITDFLVVCDETNNTPEVIDRNEFIGDIYIKPARSVNFIQLNFVAVRTGVSFSEVVGQY